MSFNPDINKTYVLLGSRGSGKTTICKQLMQENTKLGKGVDSWLVFSNGISQQQYEFLEFKKSPHRLYDTLNLDVITNAFSLNEQRKQKGKTLIRFGIVMDDCVDKRSGNLDIIQKIFTQGRHYMFSLIYLSQSVTFLPPTLRRNVDVFFILKPRMRRDINFYYEELLSADMDKKEAEELLSSLEPYQCLIVSYQDKGVMTLYKYKPVRK